MAAIHNLITDHFDSLGAGVDFSIDVCDLDIGLMQAGKIIETIYDLASESPKALDGEGIAALARALLAHLGHLGSLIDALQSCGEGSGTGKRP